MSDRAFLLIADIGGYTRFMKVHRINLAHAQDVVARLLEAVIDAAEPVFKLSKLEGDAAFFYAPLPADGKADLRPMARAITDVRDSFLRRRAEIEIDRLCSCDGCLQAAALTLKFVAHVGEVYYQRVKRFTELAGVDVIVVHRLLKNSVPFREYVLMTEPVAKGFPPPLASTSAPQEEDLEGIGAMLTYFTDISTLPAPPPPEPSRLRALLAWISMTRRSLPYMVGVRTSCDGFRNMEEVTGADPKPGEPPPPPH